MIPEDEDTVRLCVIDDGAAWIGKQVHTLFPQACQVLDSYHCSEYLHRVANVHYRDPVQACEWVEATLARIAVGAIR